MKIKNINMASRSAALALLFLPATVLAAACELPSDGTAPRSLLAACASDVADTEADLAKTYRRVRAQTPMELRPKLGRAQQAWLAYRTAECGLAANGGDGTGGAAALGCTAELNRERIFRLEEALTRGH